jgi:hypothetical protein
MTAVVAASRRAIVIVRVLNPFKDMIALAIALRTRIKTAFATNSKLPAVQIAALVITMMQRPTITPRALMLPLATIVQGLVWRILMVTGFAMPMIIVPTPVPAITPMRRMGLV